MSTMRIAVEGFGLWAPGLGDIDALIGMLAGETVAPPPARPPAARLPPNERRRAPESVLLAAEVADQAVRMSGRDAAGLACVFASSHGDQAITDYMCATLAQAPTELSPTRFHNSVHNAAVGYWTIATGCHAASIAVCAHRESFGAGLLEAVSLVQADAQPVLLVCSDIAGSGPLQEMTGSTVAFGAALVLGPAEEARIHPTLAPTLGRALGATERWPAPLEDWRAGNPAVDALDLLVPLLRRAPRAVVAVNATLALRLDLEYPA